jgi:hypothetical protein
LQGIVDYYGDCKSDILWRHTDGTVVEYQMNGTAIIDSGVVGQISNNWSVQGIGDFNGDHRDDILWRHTDGTVVEYLMNGTAIIASGVVGQPSNDWHVM